MNKWQNQSQAEVGKILELSEKEFEKIMTTTLKALMEKVDNMQKQNM